MREILWSLSHQTFGLTHYWHIIEAFNSTSRYVDDLLNIANQMTGRICLLELGFKKANSSDSEAPVLDSYSSLSNCTVPD